MNIIKKVPVPLSGVMLGTAALGNLLASYSEMFRSACGVIAFALLALILLKIIICPSMIMEDMKNPIMAGIAATFPMGVMLLTVYIKPFMAVPALIIWYAAVALHILLIIYYTAKFILNFDIKKIHASIFIVYVGIAAAGVTAPAHSAQALGMISFYFGIICFIPLFFIVTNRYIKHSEIPEPAQPLFCIFTAPVSLCAVAYLSSAAEKSINIVIALAVASFVLYLAAFIKLLTVIRLKFYPSFAAFTFPFVISAIALKQTNAFLTASGGAPSFLGTIILAETAIAVLLVCFTLIRYCMFLLSK